MKMKYVHEFRDPEKVNGVLQEITRLGDALTTGKDRPIKIMEVCGGHTHAIFKYGLETLKIPTVSCFLESSYLGV